MADQKNIIDFDQLTPQLMQDLSDIVVEEVITRGIISRHVEVVKAENGKRVPILFPLSKIGKPSRGCAPEVDSATAKLIEKTWNLKPWDFRLMQCYQDVENALYNLGLKEGVDRPDMNGTPLMELLLRLVEGAVDEMLNRFLWFGDTTGASLPSGSADAEYFKVVDGIWKQIAEMVAANNGIKHIAIAANAEATEAEQMAAEVDAFAILSDVVNNAPLALRNADASRKQVLVTDAFLTKLKMQLLKQNICTESQFTMREKGIQTVKLLGLEISSVPYWDKEIAESFNNGTKLDNPYRVLYSTRDNLLLGFPVLDDQSRTFDDFRAWYDQKDRHMYIDGMGRLDVMAVRPELISVAY